MSEAAALWEGVTGRKEDVKVKKQRKCRRGRGREVNRGLAQIRQASSVGTRAIERNLLSRCRGHHPFLANHGASILSIPLNGAWLIFFTFK